MKKAVAVLLTIVCFAITIPSAFAGQSQMHVSNKAYNVQVKSIDAFRYKGSVVALDTFASTQRKLSVRSVKFEYRFEAEKDDITGKFTQDGKVALVYVDGFCDDLAYIVDEESVTVLVDGKPIQVDETSDYYGYTGWHNVDNGKYGVIFPVELTENGGQESFLITVMGLVDGVEITENAKVTVDLSNQSAQFERKTAAISSISGKNAAVYALGDKLYIDYAGKQNASNATAEIRFVDEQGNAFDGITWAAQTTSKADAPQTAMLYLDEEKKLVDSKVSYQIDGKASENSKQEVVFALETEGVLYKTKAYTVVVRTNVQENDPKGIYFAQSSATLRVGESYTPVVLGVSTRMAVASNGSSELTLLPGGNTERAVIDVTDGQCVIGVQPGVAYITATYKTNIPGKNAGAANDLTYTASSMKIIVQKGEAAQDEGMFAVLCRKLNVRSGAGTSADKVGALSRDARVAVVSINDGWAKLENGSYVCAKYIAPIA